MGQLTVTVEPDHLEQLIRRPMTGLAELIWNAFDADATRVDVEVSTNGLDGVDGVTVTDDGTGITIEDINQYFSHLGGSWKKLTVATESGRRLHGQAGQGRWAAYALGEVIRWTTVAERVTGERQRVQVTGRRGSLRSFEVSDPQSSTDDTGTVVEVTGLTRAAQRFLTDGLFVAEDRVIEEMATIFALYLQQYPVSLTFQGRRIDPAALQSRVHETRLHVEGVGELSLVIIEWTKPTKRRLHLCDSLGTSLHDIAPGIQAPGFEFTAYLKWNGFRDIRADLALEGAGNDGPLGTILEAAKDEIRRYFKDRGRERGAELIKAWKDDDTYPYRGEPVTVVERAERDLFDILAVTAAPAVETADPKSRELSLRLLKEAIQTSPGNVHEILQEVLHLPEDRLEELRELIDKTSLSAVIAAAHQITDRLDFLNGLEQIVFDGELRQRVLERSQLHRILANETWVFREEYALTADDVTLRTALRDHIHLLGREDLTPEEVDAAPVLDEHGRRVVVDMMLSRVVEQRRNEREHIVIELKRPTIHVSMEQFGQIQKYATAVAKDSRFAAVDTRWEFWIIGDELEDSVKLMASQTDREPGVIVNQNGGKFVVRALTWAQVLQDARHRLSFVRTSLNYAGTTDDAMAYLRRAHGKYLPVAQDLGAA